MDIILGLHNKKFKNINFQMRCQDCFYSKSFYVFTSRNSEIAFYSSVSNIQKYCVDLDTVINYLID